jgi:hypothetical protein
VAQRRCSSSPSGTPFRAQVCGYECVSKFICAARWPQPLK